MSGEEPWGDDDRIGDVLSRVQLPLDNLEFVIDSYLQDNAGYLDKQTRAMLISVRENVHRIALSTRVLTEPPGRANGARLRAEEPLLEMLRIGS